MSELPKFWEQDIRKTWAQLKILHKHINWWEYKSWPARYFIGMLQVPWETHCGYWGTYTVLTILSSLFGGTGFTLFAVLIPVINFFATIVPLIMAIQWYGIRR
jgi:hypothetical protein